MSEEMNEELEYGSGEGELEDLAIERTQYKYKKTIYMKPKEDFEVNIPRSFRILRGSLSRQYFKNKALICKSFDGKHGKKRVDGAWEDNVECKDCPFLNGVPMENAKDPAKDILKCQEQYTIFLEHADEDKEYSLNMNRASQINLEAYNTKLAKMHLKINQVKTKITLKLAKKFNGTLFEFELEENLAFEEFNELEQSKVNGLISRIKDEDDSISTERFANLLMKMKSLTEAGMTMERAKQIAKKLAGDDDLITAEVDFV